MTGKPLTGRKVFAIVASAFAVIIGVNVFMAYSAINTFPGLEVGNSYVASQSFDEDRAAQEALGWTTSVKVENDELVLSVTDSEGLPAAIDGMTATLGRATHVRDDHTPDFTRIGGVYRAPVDLAKGNWNLRLVLIAEDGTEFKQRIAIEVDG